MYTKHVVLTLCVLIVVNLNLFECRRSSSGTRRSSSRVTTRSPSRRTTSSHREVTQYRSAQQATTPRYSIQKSQVSTNNHQPSYQQPKATTPRYNIQRGQANPNYNQPNQPNYNQPGYNQPGYNQPGNNRPPYTQPNYNQPHYNQPGYNQPHYSQPGYGGTNYYSPGGFQRKNDHSVRNSVLAGLGGSALGLYLGYKLGGLTSGPSGSYGSGYGNNYIGGGPNGQPQYSVVHHYHHGDRPIVDNGKVEEDVIKKCDNISFCTTNTTPLCMTNGTVYCIAPIDSTIICHENSTELKCVNSTITLPCENATACDTTALNTTHISIPCLTTIDVFAEFGSNKFTVNKVSKRSVENETSTTTEDPTTTVSTSMVTNSTTSATTLLNSASAAPSFSALTSQGIGKKYCVTVIAEPYKAPEEPPNLTNEEFAKFVKDNPEMKDSVDAKWSEASNSILRYLFS